MLRQLLLICAIGGLPLVSAAAAEEAVKQNSPEFECTHAQAGATRDQPQGPVWVVQSPAQSAAPQGPVWVVQQERPAKPMS
jgi:hypothetical protein